MLVGLSCVTNLIACVCLQVASEKNYLCDVASVILNIRKVLKVVARIQSVTSPGTHFGEIRQ